MLRTRVVPALLLRNGGLVKTVKFDKPEYIGDPINAVRIFNEKEVDELAFLDISATPGGKGPNFALLADIASEAFMPFGYGGGITTLDQIKRLFQLGIEKVILNSALVENPGLVEQAAGLAGSSSVVVSIDVKRSFLGRYSVHTHAGRRDLKREPAEYAVEMARRGAGEILLTAIDRDGCQAGYDLDLVGRVSTGLAVPVVASGGAGQMADFRAATGAGASAVAAGSMFVFHGRHRAVLITYPEYAALEALFSHDR
jgi:imidazole glycerol-phosphate synthase subunit HisF